MESQNKQILSHLRNGNRLTPLEALTLFNCFRLSGRIYDLKKSGHDIKTTIINGKKKFAEYSLVITCKKCYGENTTNTNGLLQCKDCGFAWTEKYDYENR